MNSRIKTLSLFACGAIVSSLAFSATTASALYKRESATACMIRTDTDNAVYIGSSGVWNYSTVANQSIGCAVNDDDRFRKQDIVTLNIHGYDGSTTLPVEAVTCVSYWGSNGGACGSWVDSSWGGTGNYTLSPPLTYWTSNYYADFGFVYVTLPKYESSVSSFRGYFIAN